MKILALAVLTLIIAACAGPKGDVGSTGAKGLQGAPGLDGHDGLDGRDGQPGAPGLVGPAGTTGTIVTPVKFCPNVAASYPSTFPEYGLCINGEIYAVYSANDGFLAAIPDGAYSSNAIDSSCSFHVTGCQVTW